MRKLGIAIMAWNRPHYLKQSLQSLAANDLTDCEVHLWQDGAIDRITGQQRTSEELVRNSLLTFERAGLPGSTSHLQPQNIGCAAQRYEIMPYMAQRYEWFLCLDDDVVYSPWFIHHMRVLLEQFELDQTVGSVSPGYRLLCPVAEACSNKANVRESQGHFWAEGYWAHKWAWWWEWYERYYKMVKDISYHDLGQAISTVKAWAWSVGSSIEGPSSDTAIARALEMTHLKRMRMVVNRATGIGDYGLHSYPELLTQLGDGHQPIYQWPDEAKITQFEVVGA